MILSDTVHGSPPRLTKHQKDVQSTLKNGINTTGCPDWTANSRPPPPGISINFIHQHPPFPLVMLSCGCVKPPKFEDFLWKIAGNICSLRKNHLRNLGCLHFETCQTPEVEQRCLKPPKSAHMITPQDWKPDRFQPSLFRGWQPTIHFSQKNTWGFRVPEENSVTLRHTHYVGTLQPSKANLVFLCSGGPSRRFGKVDLRAQYRSGNWSYQVSSGSIWVGPKSSYR